MNHLIPTKSTNHSICPLNEAVPEPALCFATIPDLKEAGKNVFDTCDICFKRVGSHPQVLPVQAPAGN